jgi:hypothetical protein
MKIVVALPMSMTRTGTWSSFGRGMWRSALRVEHGSSSGAGRPRSSTAPSIGASRARFLVSGLSGSGASRTARTTRTNLLDAVEPQRGSRGQREGGCVVGVNRESEGTALGILVIILIVIVVIVVLGFLRRGR